MASKQPGVWGIDLGQCALKALRLEKVGGTITATAFDYIEHPKILSQPDADPDQLTREALETFLSRNPVKGDTIIISVPGQTGLARFVKLPPVEPKKIPDIVRFEAKQQIPFSLDEVVWDWQIIGKRGEAEGFVENEIGLFAMKRDMVNRYLQTFRDVSVEVQLVQMSPLATCNYITYDVLNKEAGVSTEESTRQDCIVALDMGVDNTNMVITDGDRIIWQRPIPIGGNHFTRALTKEMKLTFAKAEHLKRNATKAEDPKRLFQCMKPVFTDFLNELQRSLGFFTNTHRTAQVKRIVALGNAFRLPGLQKFLSQSLGVEVEKFNEFNRLVGDEVKNSSVFADNVLSFAVAYGLALQGHKVTRIQTNLLPQDVQMERFIRSKKPWIVSAAAMLLLGVATFAFASGKMYDTALKVEDEVRKSTIKGEEENNRKIFAAEMEALKKAREAAQKIIRGTEERTNWSLFYHFLNDCLPQPDGRNLSPAPLPNEDNRRAINLYWDGALPGEPAKDPGHPARRALEQKRDRDERNLRIDDIDLNNLVQVNIQTVYQRFCDDKMVKAYAQNVRKRAVKESWEHPTFGWSSDPKPPEKPDSKEPMQGGWWAIEIHGYTYHKEGYRFVMNTFLENLRKTKTVRWPVNVPNPQPQPVYVSHAAMLLYNGETYVGRNDNPPFKQLGPIYLNTLLKVEENQSGGGGMGGQSAAGVGPAAPGGAGDSGSKKERTNWEPIRPFTGSGGGSDTGGTGPAGTTGGGGGGNMNMPDPGGGVGVPGGRPGGGAPGAAAPEGDHPAGGKGRFKRTEFVIVLLWFEPLPTESTDDIGNAPK
jgi:type IV pilus assembly protein PilM